jgi:ribosome-associated protein
MQSLSESFLKMRDFEKEFEFSAASSGGPGGQHANRRSTKIELRFHVESSGQLSDSEKQIILQKLSSHINNDGYLLIVSQETRSALRNRLRCKQKFYSLLAQALTPEKKRKKTKKPRSYHRKRLEKKKQKGEKKQRRKDDRLL